MISIIAIFDILGAIGFLTAFFYGIKSYKQTREIDVFWLVFAIASFFGFIWAGMVALEWLSIYPAIMDELQQPLVALASAGFAMAALVNAFSIVKPTY